MLGEYECMFTLYSLPQAGSEWWPDKPAAPLRLCALGHQRKQGEFLNIFSLTRFVTLFDYILKYKLIRPFQLLLDILIN